MTNEAAREISYSYSARSRSGRALIRAMENSTGRLGLIRRARGYELEVAEGRSFWEVIAERYGLTLQVTGGALSNIPAAGPVVVIANHPYGILDGLMLGLLLDRARGDFRILAHNVFKRAEDIRRIILPISFDDTKEAVKLNLETRAEALSYLGRGGAIGVFPGGTVSTAARPFGRPMDPGWRNFTAKMIAKSGATVVPVFFEGHNSRLFQVMSHLHPTLRMGLLIKEFRARVGRSVKVVVGDPIPPSQIAALRSDSKQMMDFLRRATYDLSPEPLKSYEHGFEFEEKYKV
ncbi:lysophospholipid acyltransferase family protein [Acidimangrovimonas sediminis]|uniref:lysophospholipid acyltransferase family protein n=1 Tax=Acidimangrovimonas sediminis TaxID=2056283 RepID=UPI000C7FFA62|nr:lysophospholipid acyltransferase family protein [Acidimangrovimonas sediminis]